MLGHSSKICTMMPIFIPLSVVCIAGCDVNCAGGCSIKGEGKCDAVCKPNYRLSASYKCERKRDSLKFNTWFSDC